MYTKFPALTKIVYLTVFLAFCGTLLGFNRPIAAEVKYGVEIELSPTHLSHLVPLYFFDAHLYQEFATHLAPEFRVELSNQSQEDMARLWPHLFYFSSPSEEQVIFPVELQSFVDQPTKQLLSRFQIESDLPFLEFKFARPQTDPIQTAQDIRGLFKLAKVDTHLFEIYSAHREWGSLHIHFSRSETSPPISDRFLNELNNFLLLSRLDQGILDDFENPYEMYNHSEDIRAKGLLRRVSSHRFEIRWQFGPPETVISTVTRLLELDEKSTLGELDKMQGQLTTALEQHFEYCRINPMNCLIGPGAAFMTMYLKFLPQKKYQFIEWFESAQFLIPVKTDSLDPTVSAQVWAHSKSRMSHLTGTSQLAPLCELQFAARP